MEELEREHFHGASAAASAAAPGEILDGIVPMKASMDNVTTLPSADSTSSSPDAS